ncbi:MAG: TonB-dependent receptor [Bryobacteraceae bacterium]|nr:TonB-dependent receptor [Bryobacteraceae bacterium]
MNSLTRTYLLLALAVCTVVPAAAQSLAGLGAINGVVRDASGAVVPAAKVVVSNAQNGIRRNLETNESGLFAAPSLAPGEGYEVSVLKEGFAAYTAKEIAIQVGQNVTLNVNLDVKAQTQEVTVTTSAPIVDESKTGVSQVVGSREIQNLPINGRRVDSFVLLTPGVVSDGTFGLVSFRGIAGGNAYLTDGNDTTNQFYNENAGRTRISTQISQDAVQEFQVLTNGYSAEFGRASGGVINTVTRSGGNDVHGTAYWFFRNRSLNARDRYATLNPPESRHQLGASIGGPIKTDKLFYFFNGEMTRRNFPAQNRIISSALTDGAGNFNASCGAATAAQCDAARSYIFRNNNKLIERTADSELLFGKLDWRPNETHSLSASFNYLRWVSPNGIQTQAVLTNNNAASNNANSTVRTRYARLAWTSIISNNIVNEARFGWFKDRLFDDVNNDFIPAATGRLGVTVGGVPVGTAIDYPRLNPSEQRWQFADNLTWTIGTHTLKLGGDLVNTQDYLKILRNQFGSYSYANFANFALDFTSNTAGARRYQNFTQRFGNPLLDFTTRDYAVYIQDQWKAARKLTVNMGMRYEYSQLPQPQQVNPNYPQTGRIPSPRMNFGPRGGIAYAMNDKTVVRAGLGVFFARFQGAMLQSLFYGNGLYQSQITVQPTQAGAPTFPNIVTDFANFPAGTATLVYAADGMSNPYTIQGDIAVDRQLARDLGLTVSYVYTRGMRITTTMDRNYEKTGAPVTYQIQDASGNVTGSYTTPTYRLADRLDSRYARLIQVENGGDSWYNGLVVQLNKRMSHGLQMNFAYTWSHAIDTANQGGGSNALFFDSLRSTANRSYSEDRGTSSLDQRHRAVTNFLWSPTFTKSTTPGARFLVNGWQLSGIFTLASAQPLTPTMRISGSPFSGAAFNTTLNGFGGSNRVPFLPFSSLDIDQVYRLDARIARELPFTERVKGYLQFEAFNVTNTVTNTFRLTEAYNMSGGVIRPTANYGTPTQSQGFPDGTNARRAQVSLRLIF